jgi:hypothetical protein
MPSRTSSGGMSELPKQESKTEHINTVIALVSVGGDVDGPSNLGLV